MIGVLPASGSATRLNGLPKFILPIEDGQSLLQWHVKLMSSACTSVTVLTRQCWIPLVQDLKLDATLVQKEPSTMADAVLHVVHNQSQDVVIGMPDVYIHNSRDNFYKKLVEGHGDIVLATWDFIPETMNGKVGQVLADNVGNVLSVVDKDFDCGYPEMWGAILFRNSSTSLIDPAGGSVISRINQWIAEGVKVTRVKMSGEYIDAGTIEGLIRMYTTIGNLKKLPKGV